MSRNQRIGLIVAAVLFAVVAFVIASPGDDDSDDQAAQTTPNTRTESQARTETEPEPAEQPHETVPPEPQVTRIEIRGGEVAGGAADIQATKGDVVRIVVSADAPDDIHLHGYDIEKKAGPGQPARFTFKADVEGIFEIESHVAEDAGKDPLIAKLTVEPG
jgi:FtsP/CotA-like multicopper oxidase with cupredoxin domain